MIGSYVKKRFSFSGFSTVPKVKDATSPKQNSKSTDLVSLGKIVGWFHFRSKGQQVPVQPFQRKKEEAFSYKSTKILLVFDSVHFKLLAKVKRKELT